MMYVVKVFRDSVLISTTEVKGIDAVLKIEATYKDIPGYEVDYHPDVFRYIRLNHSAMLN